MTPLDRLIEDAFALKLKREAERGIADFIGDGEFCTAGARLSLISGVKLTFFTLFEPPSPPGVVGNEGSAPLKLGLLGLLAKEGIADGLVDGFLALKL